MKRRTRKKRAAVQRGRDVIADAISILRMDEEDHMAAEPWVLQVRTARKRKKRWSYIGLELVRRLRAARDSHRRFEYVTALTSRGIELSTLTSVCAGGLGIPGRAQGRRCWPPVSRSEARREIQLIPALDGAFAGFDNYVRRLDAAMTDVFRRELPIFCGSAP